MKRLILVIALSGSLNFHSLIPLDLLIFMENYRRIIERLIRIETQAKLLNKNCTKKNEE